MNEVVDDSQSAFVPGKIIQDNILMAQELIRGYGRKHVSHMYGVNRYPKGL